MLLKTEGFLKKNAATILTCVGATGVVVTAVATAKATPKALMLLENAKEEKGEDLTKFEKVKIAGPAYIPAAMAGAATISCIFGANYLNKREQAGLVAAYTALDNSYKEYKEKIEELYGEEAEKEVRHEIAKDKYEENKPGNKLDAKQSNSDVLLFFDEWSNRYFWRTMEEVREAEYHFNRNFVLREYADLNEFYAFLGLDPTAFGAEVGWSMGAGAAFYGYDWVDFVHEIHESTDPDMPTYITIRMPFGPTADFMDY